MRIQAHVVIALMISLAAVPSATAWWGAKGGYEPDTARDANNGYMWADPQTGAERRVYFHGWQGEYGSLNANVANPNLRMSFYWGGDYSFYAMFGVWRDCNKDNYVGYGDQGLFEYRAELLLGDTSVCEVGLKPAKPPLDWFPSHNDGQWVRELLPFGWNGSAQLLGDDTPYNINANGTRAWLDYGLPEKYTPPALNCWYSPWPRGTTQSTGAFIEWEDCITGHRVTDTINLLAAQHESLEPLSFSDHPDDQRNSDSLLNQPNPWGQEEDQAFVDAWDCRQPPTHYHLKEESVNLDRNVTNVSQPNTNPTVNPGGSASGTMNSTMAGIDQCRRRDEVRGGGTGGGYARYPYERFEGNVQQSNIKRAADATFVPSWEMRPAAPYAAALGPGTPTDMGRRTTGTDGLWVEPVSRQETFVINNRAGIAEVTHFTYYAYVPQEHIDKYSLKVNPTNKMGAYASDACGTSTSGIKNGWDCDKSKWWRDGENNDIHYTSPLLGKDQQSTQQCTTSQSMLGTGPTTRGCIDVSAWPGSPYNLRDIDCTDQSVKPAREQGLHWGLLTDTRCEAAP